MLCFAYIVLRHNVLTVFHMTNYVYYIEYNMNTAWFTFF